MPKHSREPLSLSAFFLYTIAKGASVASVAEVVVALALASFETDDQVATDSFYTSFLIMPGVSPF